MTRLFAVVAILGLLLLSAVGFWQSRRNPRPCPWWMRWLLENPYMHHGNFMAFTVNFRKPGARVVNVNSISRLP
jgi:hypothetical protein